ncbi:TPA: LGFP repeat-containing protein [Bacillus pseudomycoides]
MSPREDLHPIPEGTRGILEINMKYEELGGNNFFGESTSDAQETSDRRGMISHFQHGTILWHPDTGAHEVHGDILKKYEEIGWERSFLGYPTADEAPFSQEGRVSVFEHGEIYWWPDVGAIELNEVVVHYTGMICFGETDNDGTISTADEPYVTIGIVTPVGHSAIRSPVYEGVDGGESMPDLIEIYRGKPYGMIIDALVMEHDEDNPDKYKDAMTAAAGAAATALTGVIGLIPGVGPLLAVLAGPALLSVVPTVSFELNRLLDFGDDKIGEEALTLTAKQMIVLAARTGNSVEKGIGFKLETPLISGEGASYKVYFGLVPA